ncbi:nuclear pore complex component-domain-containing protein [Pseudomassariella vexata]|uniref:Nuclear pore complex component-domain-containing protein n=1 Tax=Pseudomassariella vexata TaxID=1141098 RepID=A0A1Y2EJ84_9PEZI|nr:nuclear pore complex component-domain-containing protein [Pseudomassariella vexata]ORY71633.1 nuclear pore complex component-domain-containing protein [Pseudomassariella vexata]
MASLKAQKIASTPQKSPAAPAPLEESPGIWRHPRLAEITSRQQATSFTEKNLKAIVYNVVGWMLLAVLKATARKYLPTPAPNIKTISTNFYYLLLLAPIYNIVTAFWPLIRVLIWGKDELADIPLTPGQRKLLGLPPSSAPPTPGSAYSTPPRYSRTPSISGSAGSKRSFSGDSPLSNRGSLFNGNGSGGNSSGAFGGPISPFSPGNSPLLQKAMHGARRSSIGSASPLAASFGTSFGASTSSSIFGGGIDSPSPSPANGKRGSLALNNKWLYERGRRSSGNTWLHT